ncbi:YycH family regulatory protein [Paenibacillus thailandensis]|uniref:YycH family regulatory protein n=1 Tax=Paenibacillus thailandensis TaxID=393250 RepID=A0ABW5R1E6_9BACL
MIEKAKSIALVVLVGLSLIQSYFLMYSPPTLGATVSSDQDYVNTEPMGTELSVENVVFPDRLVLHFGGDEHTVLYPGTSFYDMILKERIQGREFKDFRRTSADLLNWDAIRQNAIGVELRYDVGVPVELLQKLLKLKGDTLFFGDTVDRIWIFKMQNTEQVRTFFFSADGQAVYESVQADLTVRDVQDYVNFGKYQTRYRITDDGLYVPVKPIRSVQVKYAYETFAPELMRRNLFFDPGTTRAVEGRNGSQIYTDGKRGLQVQQGGTWISYTDPAAPQSGQNVLSDNFYAAVEFVNQHGGWDGSYRFSELANGADGTVVRFQQYMESYPVLASSAAPYGYLQLSLQQGAVTEYNRSLITLSDKADERATRWLPGGDELAAALDAYDKRAEVQSLYPAFQAVLQEGRKIAFVPVWAVRLKDGTQQMLMEAYPAGYTPPETENTQPDDAGQDSDGEDGEDGGDAAGETGGETADAANAPAETPGATDSPEGVPGAAVDPGEAEVSLHGLG